MQDLRCWMWIGLGVVFLFSAEQIYAQEGLTYLNARYPSIDHNHEFVAAGHLADGWQLPVRMAGLTPGARWNMLATIAVPWFFVRNRGGLYPDSLHLFRRGNTYNEWLDAAPGLQMTTAIRFSGIRMGTLNRFVRNESERSTDMIANLRDLYNQRPVQMLHQVISTGNRTGTWERRLAIIQGSYYVVTGLLPVFYMGSFEHVTGPRSDDWLVKTAGGLVAVVGGALLYSGFDNGPSNDLKAIAAGSALTLAIIDITRVSRGQISRIYLLDAIAELALVAGWASTL